ncbi:prepilin peptidase [Proteobacteria bacterium 005FR1]|nr:prepilin peptidase [Proteobacteria bacterium 005FR1]
MPIDLTQLPAELIITIALLLGLLVGSFLNVVILRLPKMMSNSWRSDCCDLLEIEDTGAATPFNLVVPASHCPSCNHKIRPWENIPLLSYLWLQGRCSACKVGISYRYPLVELITGLLTAYFVFHFGPTLESGLALLLLWGLIALTVIDIDTQLLPDSITLPLLWLGLIVNSAEVFVPLTDAVYGAIAGYLALWSVYWIFKLLTKKEGMGYGDFKLLAALGAWMGWQALPMIILLSSFVGAFIGIAGILILGRDKNVPIPFGPYLAIAGLITFLWGDELSQFYLQVMNLQ